MEPDYEALPSHAETALSRVQSALAESHANPTPENRARAFAFYQSWTDLCFKPVPDGDSSPNPNPKG